MAIKMMGISDEITTCECCGKSNLKRTVALSIDGEIKYYGVDCAASAMKVSKGVAKQQADVIAVAQIWIAKGFSMDVVVKGIWNKYGFTAQVKNNVLVIYGVGELAL